MASLEKDELITHSSPAELETSSPEEEMAAQAPGE